MLKKAISLIIMSLAMVVTCIAQNFVIPTVAKPENDGSILPFSQQIGTDIEQVELATGGLSVHIPLISVPGRRMNYTFGLRFDPTFWTTTVIQGKPEYDIERRNYIKSDVLGWETNQPYLYRNIGSVLCTNDQEFPGGGPRRRSYDGYYLGGYIFVDSNGQRHSTTINKQVSGTCPYGNWYIKNQNSPDQNGWWFQTDEYFAEFQAISPNGIKYNGDGTSIYMYTSSSDRLYDGETSFDASGIGKEVDTHGNQQYIKVGGSDSIGRVLVTSTAQDSKITYSVPSSGGQTANYVVNLTDKVNGKTDFNDSSYADTEFTTRLVSSISLPNGTSYNFEYDNGTYHRLNISSITLPSGAKVNYTWTKGAYTPCLDGDVERQYYITKRTVTVGDQTREWDISYACVNSTTKKVTVTSPADSSEQRSQTVYYYVGTDSLSRIEYWSGVGGSLLKAYDMTYGGTTPPSVQSGSLQPRLTSIKTTLYSGTSNVVSMKEFEYDDFIYMYNSIDCNNEAQCDMGMFAGKVAGNPEPLSQWEYTSNNVVTTREYDWGVGKPGSLIRQTLRRYAYQSDYRYMFTLGTAYDDTVLRTYRNLSDLVTKEEVYDGAATCSGYGLLDENGVYTPSQSSCAANKITETAYVYDGGDPSKNGYLGNLTSVTKGIGSSAVKMSYEYDLYGNVTAVRDSAGVALSSVVYTDSWGTNGKGCTTSTSANAYPSKVTNVSSQFGTFTYDSCTGKVLSSKGPNDIANSGKGTVYSYDVMGRKILSSYSDGGTEEITYDDTANEIIAKRLLKSGTYTKSIARTSSMGETVAAAQSSGSNGYNVTYQENDKLGRKWRVYNPVSSTLISSEPSEAASYVEFSYDALGRTTQIADQNSSTTKYVYSLNKTSITNANKITTEQTSNAVGNLIKVIEDKGGVGFETQYSYDILGNLIQVKQNGGSSDTPIVRSFSYNALSQLVESQNPETGSICYGKRTGTTCAEDYDSHGNLLSKTDARGVITKYKYDALNRLLSKTYDVTTSASQEVKDLVAATPSSCYLYDSSSVTNGIGRLSKEWTRVGDCSKTDSYQTMHAIGAYDAMGRVVSEQQCVAGYCTSPSVPSAPEANCTSLSSAAGLQYCYDLAGDLLAYSNGFIPPAGYLFPQHGILFAQSFDAAGHLSQVTSSWTDNTHPSPLFSLPSYTASGALSQWLLGSNLQTNRNYDSLLRVTAQSSEKK